MLLLKKSIAQFPLMEVIAALKRKCIKQLLLIKLRNAFKSSASESLMADKTSFLSNNGWKEQRRISC